MLGQRSETLSARQFFSRRNEFMPAILESFSRLAEDSDLVIVEGAGSPAEINLREGDLANMGFAEAATFLSSRWRHSSRWCHRVNRRHVQHHGEERRGAPEGLHHQQLPRRSRALRGGRADFIENATGVGCLGVVPYFEAARKLPAEDAVALERRSTEGAGTFKIAVLRLPRIANFDDLDPLRLEPGITLVLVQPGETVPPTVTW